MRSTSPRFLAWKRIPSGTRDLIRRIQFLQLCCLSNTFTGVIQLAGFNYRPGFVTFYTYITFIDKTKQNIQSVKNDFISSKYIFIQNVFRCVLFVFSFLIRGKPKYKSDLRFTWKLLVNPVSPVRLRVELTLTSKRVTGLYPSVYGNKKR